MKNIIIKIILFLFLFIMITISAVFSFYSWVLGERLKDDWDGL